MRRSLWRRLSSPGSHRWQNWQPTPFAQPLVNAWAHGLHAPWQWSAEPTVGHSGDPSGAVAGADGAGAASATSAAGGGATGGGGGMKERGAQRASATGEPQASSSARDMNAAGAGRTPSSSSSAARCEQTAGVGTKSSSSSSPPWASSRAATSDRATQAPGRPRPLEGQDRALRSASASSTIEDSRPATVSMNVLRTENSGAA
mmetsp:Transcript_30929/g.86929  ORF Transcript_30929/g.86929 Transcript_30929/m.86929 type:complete len:203 (+) Transcript_30929:536-1144(+)